MEQGGKDRESRKRKEAKAKKPTKATSYTGTCRIEPLFIFPVGDKYV